MFASVAWVCLFAVTPDVAPSPQSDLISRLVQSLNDPDRDVRQNVAAALAGMGREALPALQAALSDPEPLRRASAAYALGLMGRDAADSMTELLKALNDPTADVRRQVSLAISRLVATTGSRPMRVTPLPFAEPPPPERFPDMAPVPTVPLPRPGR